MYDDSTGHLFMVHFIQDGYVVKTTDSISGVKAFVNICSNQHIGKASSQYMEKEENGKK